MEKSSFNPIVFGQKIGSNSIPGSTRSCWTCDNASSQTECEANGSDGFCKDNQDACFLEIRKRGGEIISYRTGCKDSSSCQNNKQQNFGQGSKVDWNCKPTDTGFSARFLKGEDVCFQCCETDNCVSNGNVKGVATVADFWTPTSETHWNEDGRLTI